MIATDLTNTRAPEIIGYALELRIFNIKVKSREDIDDDYGFGLGPSGMTILKRYDTKEGAEALAKEVIKPENLEKVFTSRADEYKGLIFITADAETKIYPLVKAMNIPINQERARFYSIDVSENRIKDQCGIQFTLHGVKAGVVLNKRKKWGNLTREAIMAHLRAVKENIDN